jgi:midasin (ATPase involved in ribosome maturation)
MNYQAMLNILRESYCDGDTIKTKEIIDILAAKGYTEKDVVKFTVKLQNDGYRIKRGVYSLSAGAVPKAEPASMSFSSATKIQAPKRPELSADYLIPKVDKNYVKFGNYDIVERALSTRRFAPIWITGLSGNGKTYSVEQACANLSRKMVMINITNETNEEDLIGSFSLETVNSYEVECDEALFAEFLASTI